MVHEKIAQVSALRFVWIVGRARCDSRVVFHIVDGANPESNGADFAAASRAIVSSRAIRSTKEIRYHLSASILKSNCQRALVDGLLHPDAAFAACKATIPAWRKSSVRTSSVRGAPRSVREALRVLSNWTSKAEKPSAASF